MRLQPPKLCLARQIGEDRTPWAIHSKEALQPLMIVYLSYPKIQWVTLVKEVLQYGSQGCRCSKERLCCY
jgi:hypothetical protein